MSNQKTTSYSLNEVLKERAAREQHQDSQGEKTLDDLSRVKVLSPGRKVFKRFIRNRLAVFGSILLITMFVFSFLGPLFYPYGQKQIFYKYDKQHINYAMAKNNTAYNGFELDAQVKVDSSVNNVMNSRIKKMIADGRESETVFGDAGAWQIDRLTDDIWQLSQVDAQEVCTYGDTTAEIGTYTMVGKKIEYKSAPVEGMEDAIKKAIADSPSGGTFELNGVTYTYTRGKAKSFPITASLQGLNYTGEALDEGFGEAVKAAAESGNGFEYGGVKYAMKKDGKAWKVYALGETKPAKLYSCLTVDTISPDIKVTTEMRIAAMKAAAGSGEYTLDGKTCTIRNENGALIVSDSDGNELFELTPFSVRRYNGDDNMDYELKKAVTDKIREMAAAGQKSGSMTYPLPMQNENGEYAYDEEGKLRYADADMAISQRDTGEYVITCDQIIYVIDMYAPATSEHILGTDGDGFDVMSRIMYGGRVSLMVGFVVVFLETFLGVVMGGLAGYYGGWVDMLIMRLVDIFYCLPYLPIMIILGAAMDAMRMDTYLRLIIMMAALGIMGWASVARLVRGQILMLRDQEFMVATEATGIRVKDRIAHHLVPNIMPQLIVQATMGMGGVILMESTLSFLGLGVKHPLATWGTIINSVSSASAMAHYAFIWIPVGILICVTVIAFNFVGDGLRDAYDPKAKR